MNAALALREAVRPIVGVHPDQEPTPEQALDDGDKQAAEAFINYARSDFMEQELFDYLLQEADSIIVRSWIRQWSAKVQRGEL